MKSYYFFMHEDKQLAVVEVIDNSQIGRIEVAKGQEAMIYLPFLPYNTVVSQEAGLKDWLLNRGVPVTRQKLGVDLMYMKSKSAFEYMLDNLGLSLTDHYWLKPFESDYIWKTVNLYTNDFKSSYSLDLHDDEQTIAGKTNFVPNASLKGDLKKKWIIDPKGVRYLVKGNYNNTCRQSLCEVLASEIHKRQGKFEYAPYRLITISSNGVEMIGCTSPCFVDLETEFIPAIDIVNSVKRGNAVSYYEMYIQYCGSHGIDVEYMRAFMEYQILVDFVLTNTDRHLNNFGIIRDSKTMEFIKPAPIFDSGNSMFYNGNIYTGAHLLDIGVTSFKKKEVQLLQYVTNPKLVDISLLPTEQEVYELFMKDPAEREDTNRKLARAYGQKVKYLDELQHGVKIYHYDYLKGHKGS